MKECSACRRCLPDHLDRCPTDGEPLKPSLAGEPVIDNRYRLEECLGHGGMGVVFKARHTYLKTVHAVKVIRPDLVDDDPSLVTRFRQEAMAAAAIRHPNVVAVTDYGIADGHMPFLVMEFIKGRTLYDILATESRLAPERVLDIMAAVCAGVGAAHDRGIVHRDLKPLNIMLQDAMPVGEGVKVLDFGLAKIKSSELLHSFVQARTTGPMGSPYYMAPEQWADEEPDQHTDIYSLGVILYLMLAGDLPFSGTSAPSIMRKHLADEPPSFASLGVLVPPAVEATVRHALAKNPADRTPSVKALIDELRDAVAYEALGRTHAVAVAKETPPSPPPPPQTTTDPTPDQTDAASVNESIRPAPEPAEGAAREPQSVLTQDTAADVLAEIEEQPSRPESRPAIRASQSDSGVPPRHIFSPKLLITAALSVALGGGLLYYLQGSFSQQPLPQQPPPQTTRRADAVPTEGESSSGPPPVVSATPEMVEIPTGRIRIGRADGPEVEKPAHFVDLPRFFINRKEVTNAEYAEFVINADHKPPDGWTGGKPPAGQEQWPVRNVSHDDAQEFAKWRSGVDNASYRLPTEEEWEYAARGGREDNLYPWGKEWVDGCANVDTDAPNPVGSHADCASTWGLLDMAGNVWEWTSSQASFYPDPHPDPRVIKYIPPRERGWMIVRGGSFQKPEPKQLWRRDYPSSTKLPPLTWRQWHPRTTTHPTVGFRLVRVDN